MISIKNLKREKNKKYQNALHIKNYFYCRHTHIILDYNFLNVFLEIPVLLCLQKVEELRVFLS